MLTPKKRFCRKDRDFSWFEANCSWFQSASGQGNFNSFQYFQNCFKLQLGYLKWTSMRSIRAKKLNKATNKFKV